MDQRLRSVNDRDELAELLRRDPVLHTYELGDLDDLFWPDTRWFRYADSVALLYHGGEMPILLALDRSDRANQLRGLLTELTPLLPERFHAHLSPGAEAALATRFRPAAGYHVGVRRREALLAVAGVHVWSPRYRVAAVGGVMTRPDSRRQGLATVAVAEVCRRLRATVEHIALNVRADNTAARIVYHRLGFTPAAAYTEALFTAGD
jgi:RimJ/RimL family protein N-acetyltransferase